MNASKMQMDSEKMTALGSALFIAITETQKRGLLNEQEESALKELYDHVVAARHMM
jgi:hypothetical protein